MVLWLRAHDRGSSYPNDTLQLRTAGQQDLKPTQRDYSAVVGFDVARGQPS